MAENKNESSDPGTSYLINDEIVVKSEISISHRT